MKPYVLVTAVAVAGTLILGAGVAVWARPAEDTTPPTARETADAELTGGPAGRPATAGPATAPAVPKAPRPTKAIPRTGCVTPACHVSVKKFAVLHGPVNVNACDACHTLTSAEKHTFKLARGKTAICTFCHKMKLQKAPYMHKPVQKGDCLPCHDPHGGANKRFLRGRTMSELCNKCHKPVIGDKKNVHGPVAAGACGACHQAHVSDLPKLLVAQGRELCLGCHAEMKKEIQTARFRHKAVEADCMKCHDPHASNYPMQTREPPLTLCTTSCHKEIMTAVKTAPHKHSVVTEGEACLTCHTAHGGDLAKLMRALPIKACMKCHIKELKIPDDGEVKPLPEILDPTMNKHGPIRTGSCGGCHEVHGSRVAYLLKKPYPETFYDAFDPNDYALCFDCHNRQLALMKETKGVTGFRNGTRNLHYVHVNKPRQGRTCRACHSTHASTNAMHVRESVPFGSWSLPINFTPTRTGGSCETGCHRKLSYDRVSPVSLGPPKAKAPTTRPSAPPPGPTTRATTAAPATRPAPKPTTHPAAGAPKPTPSSKPVLLGPRPKEFEKPLPTEVWLKGLVKPTTQPTTKPTTRPATKAAKKATKKPAPGGKASEPHSTPKAPTTSKAKAKE